MLLSKSVAKCKFLDFPKISSRKLSRSVSTTVKCQLNFPIISPQDQWGTWTALFATGAFGIWSEKTKVGGALSGALVSTLVGLAASNLGIIASEAPAYKIVTGFLLPLAVPLLLFRADMRRVLKSTGTLLLAFFLGSVRALSRMDRAQLEFLSQVLTWFQVLSDLKNYLRKCEIIPVGEVKNVEVLAPLLNCKIGSRSTYLGLPLGAVNMDRAAWNPMVERVERDLQVVKRDVYLKGKRKFATTIGTVVAFWMVPMRSLGQDGWKIAAALMGRHIGGDCETRSWEVGLVTAMKNLTWSTRIHIAIAVHPPCDRDEECQ
ncbi:hypothetical protein BC332_33805 [Capsicum chinense]|nr:hypothetical protein BC332_33805 [Capsicum chinense]